METDSTFMTQEKGGAGCEKAAREMMLSKSWRLGIEFAGI